MFYAGVVFTTGWIARVLTSYDTSSLNPCILQTVFILAGPPIYSAAEYNILNRLMNYVPMHAPLRPRRIYTFFIYLGVAVKSLTAAVVPWSLTTPMIPTLSVCWRADQRCPRPSRRRRTPLHMSRLRHTASLRQVQDVYPQHLQNDAHALRHQLPDSQPLSLPRHRLLGH